MVVIAVQGTVLRIHFEDLDEDEAIVGAIEMNEHLPSSGRGHYSHDEGTKRMWGFWDIQLYDEDTILVHTTYSHYRDHFAVVSGFVWKRFSAPSVAAGPPVQAPSRAD